MALVRKALLASRRRCTTTFSTLSSDVRLSTTEETSEGKATNLVRTLSRTTSEINNLFRSIDTNKDNSLSKEEFESAMRKVGIDQIHTLHHAISRNELSRQPSLKADVEKVSFPAMLRDRFVITAEVMVSKIFPAGFGWQTACTFAESQNVAADSAQFALYTGIGDGLGVFAGHSLYYALKSVAVDQTINVKEQIHTGLLLGTAALFSGTSWQPLVSAFSNAGYSFNQTALGTTVGCGLAFFVGLRSGRFLYSDMLDGVGHASYGNLKADAALSVSIGGACGCFVGTDVSFGASNWLRPVVGVEEGISALAASSTAGASTAMGFTAFQAVQNVTYTEGKNWVD
eukprot:GSMAST32.ASY1.ANO1.2741.1 assembled CDS